MHTDENLIRDLEAAFRAETRALKYSGRVPRPTVHRSAWSVLPAAAVMATIVVAAYGAGSGGDGLAAKNPPGAISGGVGSGPGPETGASRAPALTTHSVELAGYTLTYQVADGAREPVLTLSVGGTVPPDAAPVDVEAPARAWVGTDPASGDATLWVQAPTRAEGQMMELSSPDLSADQLVTLLHTGDDGGTHLVLAR